VTKQNPDRASCAPPAGEAGATLVEYGLLVGLISVVSLLVLAALGVQIFTAFDVAQQNIQDVEPEIPN